MWWIYNLSCLAAEKAAIEKLTEEEPWFTLTEWAIFKYRLSAIGIITAHGKKYPVRLIYPDQYPQVPPWVEPQDEDVRWSSHQYGKGGTLCLELRPDNWTQEANGADMLRSAFNLLVAENPLGDDKTTNVRSAHQTTAIQQYSWGKNPVLIGEGCLERLKNGTAKEVGALRWSADQDTFPMLVFDEIDRSSPQHPPSFDLGTLRLELPVWIARRGIPDPLPSDKASLAAALGIELDPEDAKSHVLAIIIDENTITPIHVMGIEPDSVFERKWVILPEQNGIRSGRKLGIDNKEVALIGLGSVGSKIAESLLRSGIRHFLLVDGDILFPANLERHSLDWRDVGFRKARAVEKRLHHIVPGANIKVITDNLNWQRSSKTHGNQIEKISRCDLIIDATGDAPTSMFLGAIANQSHKPFLSVEVFEGGLGCIIVRSIPDIDPAYTESRRAYAAYCDEQDVDPPTSGAQPYEALDEDSQPIVADDASVSIAGAHTTRVALDILEETVNNDYAVLLIGFKKGWLFSSHGHVIVINVGKSTPMANDNLDEETLTFAQELCELFKEAIDAARDPE